jgi:peptidoglycan-associated lipoprotein
LAISVVLLLCACGNRPEPAPVTGGAAGMSDGVGPGQVGVADRGSLARSQLGAGAQRELAEAAGDRVFFAYDRSEISPEGQRILQKQAEWLRRFPNLAITVEGHADERGTREYNLSLGERRAEAVKNVLIALGIPASRIATISYGKERPEIPHSDETSYAQNRRAVTVVN